MLFKLQLNSHTYNNGKMKIYTIKNQSMLLPNTPVTCKIQIQSKLYVGNFMNIWLKIKIKIV